MNRSSKLEAPVSPRGAVSFVASPARWARIDAVLVPGGPSSPQCWQLVGHVQDIGQTNGPPLLPAGMFQSVPTYRPCLAPGAL